MKELKHMSYFESLLEVQENELVKEAISQGRIPVGYTCSYIPTPALMVDKVFPMRLRGHEVEDVEHATYYLSPMLCSYSKSILQSAMDGNYDFLKAVVGTTSCAHMCGAVENAEWKSVINNKDLVYAIMDIPKKKNFPPNIDAYEYQMIHKFYEKLDKLYGLDYSDEKIVEAVERYNAFTHVMRQISDLRKLENPKITGLEFHTIYTACQVAPVDLLMDKLKETLEELNEREGVSDYRAKIMVMGSILDTPLYTKVIEDQGGLVVVDRYCTGSMPGLVPIELGDKPLHSLIDFWMNQRKCPKVISDTFNRMAYNEELFNEFNADGIVFEKMKFCELWAYESVTANEVFNKLNIPHVIIERDYDITSEGQLRTRIQAFIEGLEIKRINQRKREVSS